MTMEIRPIQMNNYDSVYSLWLNCKGMGLNNLDDSQEGITRNRGFLWKMFSYNSLTVCPNNWGMGRYNLSILLL